MEMNPHIRGEILQSEIVTRLLNDNIMSLDNSTFTNWNGCFVKGMFAGALKRNPVRGQVPLVFGGAVHEALEHFHKGMPMTSNDPEVECALDKAMEFANPADPENAKDGVTLNECANESRNTERLRELLIMYELDYSMRMDKFNILNDEEGKPWVEKSFRLPLGSFVTTLPKLIDGKLQDYQEREVQIMWEGKIDVVEVDDSNDLWVIDHKTTSVMGKQFPDQFMRSSQMLGYNWALRQLTDTLQKNVRGVKINAIALRKHGFDFERFPIQISEWAVQEWWDETVYACQDIADNLVLFLESNKAVPSRESCVTKYGKCPFYECCQTAPQVRSQLLLDDDYFYTSKWSPLN